MHAATDLLHAAALTEPVTSIFLQHPEMAMGFFKAICDLRSCPGDQLTGAATFLHLCTVEASRQPDVPQREYNAKAERHELADAVIDLLRQAVVVSHLALAFCELLNSWAQMVDSGS